MSASYYTTDSIRDYVQDKLGAFSAALAWLPSSQTTVMATLDYSDQRYRTDYGVPAAGNRPADLPWSRQFNDAPDLSFSKTTSLRLEVDHQPRFEHRSKWQVLSFVASCLGDHSLDLGLCLKSFRLALVAGVDPLLEL
ncbi:hypothetical protein [Roseateles sp.]|uniref:hypothetical protein n=1 Tax=Roseateles sp. TaxID=1971397 RepID=UPI003BAA1E9D